MNIKLKKLATVGMTILVGVLALTTRAEAPEMEEVFSQLPEEVVENIVVDNTTIEEVVENTTTEASSKKAVKLAECPAEEKVEVTMESSTKSAETSATVEAPTEIIYENNDVERAETARAVESAKNSRS